MAGGAKPNDLAAIQVNPNSTDWILATVISQDPDTGMYQLADEDAESNKGECRREICDSFVAYYYVVSSSVLHF